MKIAVTAQGNSLDSQVSMEFEKSPYLLIVDMNDLSFTAISNEKEIGNELAEKVLSFDCEAVITGKFLESDIFYKIADACVTRYKGDGHTVQDALILMDKHNKLDLIREFDGEGCSGDHHHHHDNEGCGESSCGESGCGESGCC